MGLLILTYRGVTSCKRMHQQSGGITGSICPLYPLHNSLGYVFPAVLLWVITVILVRPKLKHYFFICCHLFIFCPLKLMEIWHCTGTFLRQRKCSFSLQEIYLWYTHAQWKYTQYFLELIKHWNYLYPRERISYLMTCFMVWLGLKTSFIWQLGKNRGSRNRESGVWWGSQREQLHMGLSRPGWTAGRKQVGDGIRSRGARAGGGMLVYTFHVIHTISQCSWVTRQREAMIPG